MLKQTNPLDPREQLEKGVQEATEAVKGFMSYLKQKIKGPEVSKDPVVEEARVIEDYVRQTNSALIRAAIFSDVKMKSLLESVENLQVKRSLSYQDIYNEIYLKIPDSLIASMLKVVEYCQESISVDDGESYEVIIKRYMDYAADLNNVFVFIPDGISSLCKTIDSVIHGLNQLTHSSYETLDVNTFLLKPALLALVWALLMINLAKKYAESYVDFEMTRIVKLSLSIIIAEFVGLTGYIHSGGYTGVWSPTPLINTYFNVQKTIENRYPTFYAKIPRFLKFPSCQSFDNLISEKQISASRGLNMAYTFRVGDSLLTSLQGSDVRRVSESVVKNILRALCPLPSEYESNRMYNIYSGNRIYYL